MGLELVVCGLFLPALVVGGGELVGASVGGGGDGGKQHDQLPGAVTFPVRHVVLDDPDQVRGLIGQVGTVAGRGDDRGAAPRAADLRVDQDRQVGPVSQDLDYRQAQPGGGPPQQRRPGSRGQPPGVVGVEVAVRGEQLLGPQPLVEPVGQGLLPGRVGPDLRGHERVGTAVSYTHLTLPTTPYV